MASFERSLVDCFTSSSHERHATSEAAQRIASFAQSIADQAIELLPGVAETFAALAARHRCILVTKGNAPSSRRSWTAPACSMHFAAVEIPPEKHPDAYREIVTATRSTPESTWMIGNSPRSDINPALAAGLHAVYVHHPNTWVLEHDESRQGRAASAPHPARPLRRPHGTLLMEGCQGLARTESREHFCYAKQGWSNRKR